MTAIDRELIIPQEHLEIVHSSYCDPVGQVFRWEKQLYRGIKAHSVSAVHRLFEDGVVEDLVDRGLFVETELTGYTTKQYPMVLHHREVQFVSYAHEWSVEMLRAAALLVLEVHLRLGKFGYTLKDAHPWNVLFDGPNAVFVDFGSIAVRDGANEWAARDEFCRYFLHPLLLFSQGYGHIARMALQARRGVGSDEVSLLRRRSEPTWASWRRLVKTGFRRARIGRRHWQDERVASGESVGDQDLNAVREMYDQIEGITLPEHESEWSEYYEACWPGWDARESWTAKHRSVAAILEDIRPRSVLDIGSNRGWYSQFAARSGISVIAFDEDEVAVDRMFQDARSTQLAILPLVMDFTNPTPGSGVANKVFPPANERFKCDFVLALALIHHLVLKKHITLDLFIEGVSSFGARWLLVEFVPPDDRFVREWAPERYPWYTLDTFVSALAERYSRVSVFPSHPDPRVLVLCEL